MMQAKGQKQTLQSTIDKRRKHRRGGRRIGNPHAKGIDSCLHHRPDHCQHQRDDHRPDNHHHGYKPLPVEKCQGIRQFPEIIILIIYHATGKPGDNSHKHTHIQRRRPQHGSEISVYQNLLPEQRMRHSLRIIQHSRRHSENRTRDTVNQDKGNHSRKCSPGTLLCPGAADGHGKQNMQVIDHSPADIFHGAADHGDHMHIHPGHLHQLAKADHQTCRRHNRDNHHQHLAQLLQKVKINGQLLFRLLTGCFVRSISPGTTSCPGAA